MANPEYSLHSGAQPMASTASAPTSVRQWLLRISVNDWIVFSYLLLLDVAIVLAEHRGPARAQSIIAMSSLLGVFITVVMILIRGGILTHPVLAPLAFRLSHFGGIQLTYFFMRGFLPIVNPGSVDAELHQVGTRLFGLEPAIAMERWLSLGTTEWFAFFYYGYFFVLGLHVLPILFLSRNPRILSEFSMGLLLVLSIGQSLYLVVPGYGPANLFDTQVPPSIWWNLVIEIVASAGAQKDIFPSIHTAAPTLILLFSFHNRAHLPYRYTWPLVAFFVFNIIIATMFLRWHWLVDIVAGLTLALLAFFGGVYGTRWETQRRARLALPPAWPQWPSRPDEARASVPARAL
jgi:PAP2 superfamily